MPAGTATSGGLPATGVLAEVGDQAALPDPVVVLPDRAADGLRAALPDQAVAADVLRKAVLDRAVDGLKVTREDITGPARVMTGPNPATNVNPTHGHHVIRFPSRLDFSVRKDLSE